MDSGRSIERLSTDPSDQVVAPARIAIQGSRPKVLFSIVEDQQAHSTKPQQNGGEQGPLEAVPAEIPMFRAPW